MLRIRDTEGKSWGVPNDGTATGFVEGGTYVIHLDGPGTVILVDDVPLEQPHGHKAFLWRPGFYAGQVIAEVLDDQQQIRGSYTLDVGPSPEKLGGPQFLSMVREILAFRPDLLLGNGATSPEFGREGNIASPEVDYARLRRYGPHCLAALRAVCATPLTHLHQQRRTVMPHQARRLDTAAVRELARSRFAGQALDLETVSSDEPMRVSVPHAEHSFDNAANRAMAAVVDRLIARSNRLCQDFANVEADAENPLTLKVPRRLHVLGAFHDALRRLQRSPALRGVTRPEITAAGLNAISAQPSYARAFQQAWKALRTGILGDSHDDPIPISPTWEVFERWCFLRVWQMFEAISPNAGWTLHSKDRSSSGIKVRGVVDDTAIVIHLQPTFPAWDQASASGFRSLSRLREPDLVVTAESPRARCFLVLDAKYRASRSNVLDAMQSAHVYRDSLRWHGKQPWGSYLLLPRHGAAEWLAEPAFHAQFGVGTFELTPNCDASQLRELLTTFLAQA